MRVAGPALRKGRARARRGGKERRGDVRTGEGRGGEGRHFDKERLVVSPLVHNDSDIVDVALYKGGWAGERGRGREGGR